MTGVEAVDFRSWKTRLVACLSLLFKLFLFLAPISQLLSTVLNCFPSMRSVSSVVQRFCFCPFLPLFTISYPLPLILDSRSNDFWNDEDVSLFASALLAFALSCYYLLSTTLSLWNDEYLLTNHKLVCVI